MTESRRCKKTSFLDFVFRHFLIKKASIDLQPIGGFRFVSSGKSQCVFNEFFFKFSDGFVKRKRKQVAFQ